MTVPRTLVALPPAAGAVPADSGAAPEPPAATVDWLAELAAGSESALSRLIETWGPSLHRFVYRYLQDEATTADLVQETFVRAYQQRARYRPGGSPSAWLFTIAANLCHNHRRWQRRHPAESLDAPVGGEGGRPAPGPAAPHGSPADRLARQETAAAVRAAIEALPHEMRVTLLLFEFEDLSYSEIAAVVGCSPRGVETRLLRARTRLKAALGALWAEVTSGPAPRVRARPA